jgi:hypothetical protein
MIKIKHTDYMPKEELEELLTELYKNETILHIQLYKMGHKMWNATLILDKQS